MNGFGNEGAVLSSQKTILQENVVGIDEGRSGSAGSPGGQESGQGKIFQRVEALLNNLSRAVTVIFPVTLERLLCLAIAFMFRVRNGKHCVGLIASQHLVAPP